MARTHGNPPRYWQKQLGNSLVFASWRGIDYVRTKGYPKPRTRSAAELQTVADFTASSVSYKDRDPTTNDALYSMVLSTQKRQLDAFIGLQFGNNIEQTGWTYKPATEDNRMLTFDLMASIPDAELTWAVNSTSYQRIAPRALWVPFDLATYNRYRILGWGRSNAAGQTVDLQLQYDTSPFNPVGSGAVDVQMNNTEGFRDSGELAITSPPNTFERLNLAIKGSNSTVDASFRRLLVLIWQA